MAEAHDAGGAPKPEAGPEDDAPAGATMAGGPRRHGERLPAAFFVLSIIGGLGLAVVYWQGGQAQLEGVFLALALGGFGIAMVLWAKRFMPEGPDVEPRGRLASTPEEIEAFAADFESGEYELERRSLLTKLMIGAGAALGLAVLFPIRSLGPRPGEWMVRSPFRRGMRLVDEGGNPVRPGDLRVDGVLTVFPEGGLDDEYAQTLLIRLNPERTFTPRPGREGWTVDGLVAYSKVCTHVGCPVGLYEARFGQLLCPCHQSTFDVYQGAKPVFGPAATSLPQLPLGVDDEGYLIAEGGFSDPIGPGFWNQDRQWERNP
ncbi:ubiquinol-cytochrome c reductase iron-sulfur subunit [Rhabdothermincola sp.]|uniref:ubiquinol-cytochrome c reductase iron-sulfur subunit n=1 Tax=Rhabdothermincola sp. TaxID=2820405 RepID=UPI002FE2DB5F